MEFHKLARTSPERAAEQIIAGILKDKRRVLVGNDAWFIDKIQRLFPLGYQKLLERRTRRVIAAG
jgi:hypothetical protein